MIADINLVLGLVKHNSIMCESLVNYLSITRQSFANHVSISRQSTTNHSSSMRHACSIWLMSAHFSHFVHIFARDLLHPFANLLHLSAHVCSKISLLHICAFSAKFSGNTLFSLGPLFICAHFSSGLHICVHLCSFMHICVHSCSFAHICVHLCSFSLIQDYVCSFQPLSAHLLKKQENYFFCFMNVLEPFQSIQKGLWWPKKPSKTKCLFPCVSLKRGPKDTWLFSLHHRLSKCIQQICC